MPESSGSGGSSNAVRAGGAFVEIYTQDNLSPGLAQAGAELKQFSATAAASMTQAGKAALDFEAAQKRGGIVTKQSRDAATVYSDTIKELNALLAKGTISQETFAAASKKAGEELKKATPEKGGLGEKTEGLANAAGFGGLVEKMKSLGSAVGVVGLVYEGFNRVLDESKEKLQKAIEKSQEFNAELLKLNERRFGRERIEATLGTPEDRLKTNADQLKDVTARLASASDALLKARAALKKATEEGEFTSKVGKFTGPREAFDFAQRQIVGKDTEANDVKTAADAHGQLIERLRELNEQRRKLLDPAWNIELKQQSDDLVKAIKADTEALSDQETEAARIARRLARLKEESGGNAAIMSGPQAAAAANLAARQTKDTNAFVTSIEKEIAAFGRTAGEAKAAEFALKGYGEAQNAIAEQAGKRFDQQKLANDAKELTKAFKEQAKAIGLTGEEAQILHLKLQGATNAALGPARDAAIALSKARAEDEKRKLLDDQMNAYAGTSVGGGFASGRKGQFDYGSGPNTTNDILKRIEKIETDSLAEQKRIRADVYQ